MAQANRELRQEQNARRDRAVTLELMIKELREEANDPRTSPDRRCRLENLLTLEEITRPR